MRSKLFISYARADAEHLKRLVVHLRPLEREEKIDVWADTKISSGDRWRGELEQALKDAAIAVLLVSADFLASDFIAENELPPLLERESKDGLVIIPVIVNPQKSLIACEEYEKEEIWLKVFREVKQHVSVPDSMSEPTELGPPDLIFEPFFGEELRHPERIKDYYVYQYQHIDDLSFMPVAEAHLRENYGERAAEVLPEVIEALKLGGWEGDGAIQILWIPPFMGAGAHDTFGVTVWFVKQENDGTAFMASPVPLPFARLLEQN